MVRIAPDEPAAGAGAGSVGHRAATGGVGHAADGAGRDAVATGSDRAGRWLGLRRRPDLYGFLIIFVVALGLRGVYLYQVRSCPFFGHEIMDPAFHREWGVAIAAGETFTEGPYFRGPLYPWFLGLIYWLFGESDLAPRIVQIVIGAASCGLVYLIGVQAFRRRTGLLAGLAAATYWVFLYFEAELLIAWLAVFLDLLLVWLLLRAQERQSPWPWLVAGGVLGLSALARPSVLLFAPAILIWLGVLHRSSWRRVLGCAGCFVLGCVLLVVPVTVRNYVAGGDRVLISSSAGVNFFIGNNPGSDGMTAIVPGTPAEWWAGYYAQIERAEQAAGRRLKASEVSRYYWREAFKFMRAQPGQATALLVNKLRLFWSRWEISNNQDIRFVTDNFTPVVRFLPLTFWVVGPLGLLGLLLSLGRARRLFPLWGFVLVYMVGVVAFFVTARYRLPVVPVLMVLGSHALFWCIDALRAARWRSVAWAMLVLVPAAVLVSHVPEGVEVGEAQTCGSAGIVLAEQGRTAEAEEYLQESLRRYTGQPKVWFTLGLIRMQQGDLVEAEACLSRTVALAPDHAEARKHLGFVLARQDKTDGAILQFTRALALSPDDAQLHANLGSVLIQSGRIPEGIERLRRSTQLDPRTIRSFESTAQALVSGRRFADALLVLEAGVAESPENVGLLSLLARVLAVSPERRLRDEPRAVQYAERACELSGRSDPAALDTLAAAYFAVGRVDEALAAAQRAERLAVQQGKEQLTAAIRARLRVYQSRLAAPGSQPSTTPDNP